MLLSNAHSYVKVCLGGPTPADYEALLAERELLKKELSDARQQLEELRLKVRKVPLQHTQYDVCNPCVYYSACAGLLVDKRCVVKVPISRLVVSCPLHVVCIAGTKCNRQPMTCCTGSPELSTSAGS